MMILTSFSVFAIVGHPANQVFPGLFANGNYNFTGDVKIEGSPTFTGGVVYFGPYSGGASQIVVKPTGNAEVIDFQNAGGSNHGGRSCLG